MGNERNCDFWTNNSKKPRSSGDHAFVGLRFISNYNIRHSSLRLSLWLSPPIKWERLKEVIEIPLEIPTPTSLLEWVWLGLGLLFGRAFGKPLDHEIQKTGWFNKLERKYQWIVKAAFDFLHHWWVGALLMAYSNLFPFAKTEIFWFGLGLLIDDLPDIPPRIRGYLEYLLKTKTNERCCWKVASTMQTHKTFLVRSRTRRALARSLHVLPPRPHLKPTPHPPTLFPSNETKTKLELRSNFERTFIRLGKRKLLFDLLAILLASLIFPFFYLLIPLLAKLPTPNSSSFS